MRILISCVQRCQFRDLDFNKNWNIGNIDKRIFKKHRWGFSHLQKNYFSFQFHVNLEYYILGSQIRVNFIDFNCYCHWFKIVIVGKISGFTPLPPSPTISGFGTPLYIPLCPKISGSNTALNSAHAIIITVRSMSIFIKNFGHVAR